MRECHGLMREHECAWSPVLAGLAIVSICLLSGHEPAFAQDRAGTPATQIESAPPDERPQPAADTELEETAPEGEPGEKRRLFKRIGPRGLTPEEEEEAERLRKLAAKYGTDPTAIVGRVQLSSQYLDLPNNARATETTARVDLPFRGNYLLRMDMPFLKWSDPDRPGTTSEQGTSDLSVTLGWRAYNTPEYAILVGVLSTFPTASEQGLGLGKYTVGPAVATARFIPRWDSFLIALLQYQASVGGDPSRRDVSQFRGVAQINSFWAEKWWSIVNGVWQVNWEQNGKSSMTMEFEVGRSLIGRWGMYARPGVGIWGQSLAGAYQWNVEVGIRYVFPSFFAAR